MGTLKKKWLVKDPSEERKGTGRPSTIVLLQTVTLITPDSAPAENKGNRGELQNAGVGHAAPGPDKEKARRPGPAQGI